MPEIGRLAVCLALLFALWAVVAALLGARGRRTDLVRSSEHAAYVVFDASVPTWLAPGK